MRQQETVDYEKLFFMLKENPIVRPMFRSLKDGDHPRTEEQMRRAVMMNLKWAEKIVPLMLQQIYLSAISVKQKIIVNSQKKPRVKSRELTDWL